MDYTITATVNSALPITGFFLNAIDDPNNGLPTGGPGRQPSNGNFVLSEFTVATAPGGVPEPSAWAMMIGDFGLVGSTLRYRRRTGLVFG